jgi:HPt (histidine-containing phosphotransfer) domain-containing protein
MKRPSDEHPMIHQETIDGLIALGEGDPDPKAFLREIIATYRATTPEIHASLLKSMDAKDIKQTIFLAHKLKGQSGNVGLGRLAALCEEIESSGESADFVSQFPEWRPLVDRNYADGLVALQQFES